MPLAGSHHRSGRRLELQRLQIERLRVEAQAGAQLPHGYLEQPRGAHRDPRRAARPVRRALEPQGAERRSRDRQLERQPASSLLDRPAGGVDGQRERWVSGFGLVERHAAGDDQARLGPQQLEPHGADAPSLDAEEPAQLIGGGARRSHLFEVEAQVDPGPAPIDRQLTVEKPAARGRPPEILRRASDVEQRQKLLEAVGRHLEVEAAAPRLEIVPARRLHLMVRRVQSGGRGLEDAALDEQPHDAAERHAALLPAAHLQGGPAVAAIRLPPVEAVAERPGDRRGDAGQGPALTGQELLQVDAGEIQIDRHARRLAGLEVDEKAAGHGSFGVVRVLDLQLQPLAVAVEDTLQAPQREVQGAQRPGRQGALHLPGLGVPEHGAPEVEISLDLVSHIADTAQELGAAVGGDLERSLTVAAEAEPAGRRQGEIGGGDAGLEDLDGLLVEPTAQRRRADERLRPRQRHLELPDLRFELRLPGTPETAGQSPCAEVERQPIVVDHQDAAVHRQLFEGEPERAAPRPRPPTAAQVGHVGARARIEDQGDHRLVEPHRVQLQPQALAPEELGVEGGVRHHRQRRLFGLAAAHHQVVQLDGQRQQLEAQLAHRHRPLEQLRGAALQQPGGALAQPVALEHQYDGEDQQNAERQGPEERPQQPAAEAAGTPSAPLTHPSAACPAVRRRSCGRWS